MATLSIVVLGRRIQGKMTVKQRSVFIYYFVKQTKDTVEMTRQRFLPTKLAGETHSGN